MLNHCLEWYKWVLTNVDHHRLWFNTLIRPSHESPVVYFVCRSFGLLQVQGCQTVTGSRLFVAKLREVIVMCATACFDIGYKVSDIVVMKVIQLRRNANAFYLQWARTSGVVWRIVKPTYHSSVEWLIADVTDVSTLHQLSVFHAWVIVRLTLRYTTPDIHCRDRPYECDGGINNFIAEATLGLHVRVNTTSH